MAQKQRLIATRCCPGWEQTENSVYLTQGIRTCIQPSEDLTEVPYEVQHRDLHNQDFDTHERQRVSRYRAELTPILNKLHGVSFSEHYWGILINTWLMHFVSIVYDRTNKLLAAREQFPQLYMLSYEFDADVPFSGREMYLSIITDEFNEFIYSLIAEEFDIEVERNHKITKKIRHSLNYKNNSLVNRVMLAGIKLWARLSKPVTVIGGYFSSKDAIHIMAFSLGRVLILPGSLISFFSSNETNRQQRKQLLVENRDRYDRVANRLFAYLFPKSVLESFKAMQEGACEYAAHITAIGSAHGIHSNPFYAAMAAEVSARNRPILGFQHGGNYNLFKYLAGEYYERLYANRWYGWTTGHDFGMTPVKLQTLEQYRDKASSYMDQKSILLLGNQDSRYILRKKVINADNFIQVVANQTGFYNSLSPALNGYVLVRTPMAEYGWCIEQKWVKASSTHIQFDQNRKFIDSLLQTRIVVTDNFGTTWLEALYLNIPIVVYFCWQPIYEFNDEVAEIMDELRQQGVLHSDPHEAAAFVNEVYDSVDDWWESEPVQKAVQRCINYFIANRGNNLRAWAKELLSWKTDPLAKGSEGYRNI